MARVPLLFRGVAVLLLAASAVVGQTPEPPAELLSLDSVGPSSPDFLRQFSADPRHPLLSLMADGELTAFETAAPQEASKLKPTPKASSAASKSAAAEDDCVLDGGQLGDGGLAAACPTVSDCLPFACSPPQPCCCRKCQRQRKRCHGHCGGNDYGNPYLNWPTCPAWCFYGAPLEPCNQGCCGRGRCRKHCGRNQGYGWGCDGCFGGWGEDGFLDGCGFGCMPPPSQKCCFHNRQRCHRQHCCGSGWGMDYGGYLAGGFCGDCMPPPCNCRKCQRKHRCSSGCGYCYGYSGWGMDGCYGGGCGCGKHHGRRGLFHRCCHQQPYPMMMPCMDGCMFDGAYAFGGGGLVGDGIVGDGFVGDGFAGGGVVGEGIVGNGFFTDGSLEPIMSSTGN
jgi:hypothetical protein